MWETSGKVKMNGIEIRKVVNRGSPNDTEFNSKPSSLNTGGYDDETILAKIISFLVLDARGSQNEKRTIFICLYKSNTRFHCVYIYHISFIYSSVCGHLDCFHNLAIVDNAAINIGVHVSI